MDRCGRDRRRACTTRRVSTPTAIAPSAARTRPWVPACAAENLTPMCAGARTQIDAMERLAYDIVAIDKRDHPFRDGAVELLVQFFNEEGFTTQRDRIVQMSTR